MKVVLIVALILVFVIILFIARLFLKLAKALENFHIKDAEYDYGHNIEHEADGE